MSETKIIQFKKPVEEPSRLTPSTCTEAETFALQVLDNSMEPEFREHCIIVIDPTGRATDGSYVLAKHSNIQQPSEAIGEDKPEQILEQYLFRQLCRDGDMGWRLSALNKAFADQPTASDLSEIVGVVVQRAGVRRRYHKRYD